MNTQAMRRTRLLVPLVFGIFLAQARAQDAAKKIDELMGLYHDYGQFNGSVLVAEGGSVIYKKGFGLADMEWNLANAPDTKFRLGSVTKQFTSMLVMQQVEKGRLRLDGRVSDYLPYYRKETGDRITVRHLLTHTSGIPNYTALPHFFEDVSRNPFGVKEFVQKYCSGDLEFEPGSKFSYSNSGYFVLGAILEQVTGEPYERLLREGIFDPLGMKDTGYDHWEAILPRRAVGYEKSLGGYATAPYLDMSIPFSAGSLYSTVEDLYRWDQALYTERLITAKSREMIFTPYLGNYAFGWVVRRQPVGPAGAQRVVIGHEGGINGFNTLITRIPEDRHLVVLLNNTGGAPLEEAAHGIIGILYGRPAEPPKRSIAAVLLKT
ncbi:MAG TPA: serine hydrolase domain-containing protein, partial [Terriglobia bacterium]|nr:serine hydrolase domain-containing protein [Terriglobia bacterium]